VNYIDLWGLECEVSDAKNAQEHTNQGLNGVFTVGISGSAAYGMGVRGSTGVAIGYSQYDGFSFGFYGSFGLISGIPPSVGAGVTLGLNPSAFSVHDLNGKSQFIGASIGPVSVDIATDNNAKPMLEQGGSVTLGIKSLEFHLATDETSVIGVTTREIFEGIDNVINEYILIPILESIPW
jgi:hypothetical protein